MKRIIIIICCLTLLAFKTGNNKSQYTIPLKAWSVTAGDIDQDGDNDIIVGHNYSSQTEWSGVSIMLNDGEGLFSLFDSIFLYGGQSDILTTNLNQLPNHEIIGYYINDNTRYIAIINDFNLNDISYFQTNTNASLNYRALGDINNNGNSDIIVASNNGQLWGVFYSDGIGNFSEPEYTYVEETYPLDIACGDLNGDGREDVVVCGNHTEVYFSYPDYFELYQLNDESASEGASIIDFDLDGDKDIITFQSYGITYVKFHKNNNNNSLESLPHFIFQPSANDFFVTDFNNDSLPDIIFMYLDQTGFILYYNLGDFQLGNEQFIPLNTIEGQVNFHCEDMDGNGYHDIVAINSYSAVAPSDLHIIFNDGNGNFQEDPISGITTQNIKSINHNLNCYPNPFRNNTTFELNKKETEYAELSIYDFQGRLIICLTNKNQKGGFPYHLIWNGLDMNGKPCKPGSFVASLKVNGVFCSTVKIIKL